MAELHLEEDAAISLWAGQQRVAPGSNFLRDLYGVDDYDPDNQECIVEDSVAPIKDIISKLSYSDSFVDAAVVAADQLGIRSALWVMAQFDYAYDPAAAGIAPMPQEPVFIGRFDWNE